MDQLPEESKIKSAPIETNFAFVDGQNMYLGTTKCAKCAKNLGISTDDIRLTDCLCRAAWKVDLAKFRIYLTENYKVSEAYYFLGNLQDKNEELYQEIQRAGFILIFKEHNNGSKSKKKGNVDADLVYEAMKAVLENPELNKIVVVSGDGDYKKLITYLISKGKFRKILFPNKEYASSLYDELGGEYFDFLENIRNYIEDKKEKGP